MHVKEAFLMQRGEIFFTDSITSFETHSGLFSSYQLATKPA